MIPNPCPCTTAERGVKIVAIVDGVVSCILTFLKISRPADAERAVAILGIILCIIRILFDIGLFWGAHKKKAGPCCAWIGLTAVFAIIDFIFSVRYYKGEHPISIGLMADPFFLIFTMILEFFIVSYLVYVVYAFTRHLKSVQNGQSQYNMPQSQGQSQAAIEEIPPVVSYMNSNADQ